MPPTTHHVQEPRPSLPFDASQTSDPMLSFAKPVLQPREETAFLTCETRSVTPTPQGYSEE